MIIRETVLLPSFQYIVKLLEDVKSRNDILVVIDSLEKYAKIQSEKIQVSNKVSAFIEHFVGWLRIYKDDSMKARKEIEKEISSDLECGLCQTCHFCQKQFLQEVYKILYKEEYVNEQIRNKDSIVLFRELPKSLNRHISGSVPKASDYYLEYCKELRQKKVYDNRFFVLKDMSSSTPSILNSVFSPEKSYDGGGFLFKWGGIGVAIDPGYRFIENLHRSGLSVLDVDVVVITHEHIDHTNDIRVLDDLNYSLHRFSKDTKGAEHKITWYLDEITYKLAETLQKEGSGFDKKLNILYKIEPQTPRISWEEDRSKRTKSIPETGEIIGQTEDISISLQVLGTQHEQRDGVFLLHTFAALFNLKDGSSERRIFYTSDTGYFPKLSEMAEGSDLIIANISSVRENDLLRLSPMEEKKNTHLGYSGCYELLRQLKNRPPKLFLVSEFWNGITDIRFDVSKYLRDSIMEEDKNIYDTTQIVPAQNGMQVDLRACELQCSICKRFSGKMIFIKPDREYEKIRSICDECYF